MTQTVVKARRIERGLKQEELARLIGVGLRTVQRWDAGANVPQLRLRRRLAQILGVREEDLIPDEEGQGAA